MVSTLAPTRPARSFKYLQAAQKGPDARRRPKAAREAYSLYVERAVEGANEADGPLSAACLGLVVEMTCHRHPGCRLQLGLLLGAAGHDLGTARVEAAACGRVERARDLAHEHDPVARFIGMGGQSGGIVLMGEVPSPLNPPA